MPKEIRRILFDFKEVSQALHEYANNSKANLPSGHIARVRFGRKAKHDLHTIRDKSAKKLSDYNVSDATDNIVINFFDDTTLEHNYSNVSTAFVAAALIEYCINNDIVLPKEAEKSIDIEELHFCLDIHFDNPLNENGPILSLEEE